MTPQEAISQRGTMLHDDLCEALGDVLTEYRGMPLSDAIGVFAAYLAKLIHDNTDNRDMRIAYARAFCEALMNQARGDHAH